MTAEIIRQSVAYYEHHNNALLRAVSPDGILYDCVERGPFEALLVPRELSLRLYALTPYLQLGAREKDSRHHGVRSPLTPYDSHDLPDLWVTSSATDSAPAATPPLSPSVPPHTDAANASRTSTEEIDERLRHITSAEFQRIKEVMRELLRYHLIHFDNTGNSRFTTAHGDRGEFSESLDTVKRFGRLGKPAVLVDMDPLVARDGTCVAWDLPGSGHRSRTSLATTRWTPPGGGTQFPPYHPATLQLFVIDQLLMDSQELQQLTHRLDSILRLDKTTHGDDAKAAPPPAAALPSNKPVREKGGNSRPAIAEPERPPSAATHPHTTSVMFNGVRVDGHREADENDDIIVEEDLSTYVNKSVRRERVQQEMREALEERQQMTDKRGDTRQQPPSAPPSPAAGAPAPRPERQVPTGRTNRLSHMYTKESIKDYQRLAAADNDINYYGFQRLMESKTCFPLAKLVSDFVAAAQARGKGFKDNHSYNILVNSVQDEIGKIPMIRGSPHLRTDLGEGIEKYVTSKLYFRFFNVDERERRVNNMLQEKFHRMERLTATQLEALEGIEQHHVWGQAMFELDAMNFFKSPREKLQCALRASEFLGLAIGDIIMAQRKQRKNAPRGEGGNGAEADRPPPYATTTSGEDEGQRPATSSSSPTALVALGADEFLPCFMLLVLRAEPYNFYQNVRYIEKFRGQHLQSFEESYCLANLASAVEFWLHCDDEGKLDSQSTSWSGTAEDHAASPAGGTTTRPAAAGTELPVLGTAKPVAPRGGRQNTRAVQQGRVIHAPAMRKEDLLPSVRQSLSMRQTTRTSIPTTSSTAAEKHADQPPPLLEKARAFSLVADTDPTTTKEPAARATTSTPFPEELFMESASAPAFSTGNDPFGVVTPPPPTRETQPSSREPAYTPDVPPEAIPRIHELLGVQNKSFEELSTSDLRDIIDEARRLTRRRQ